MTELFDPQKYGAPITELIQEERLNDLGPGQPNQAAYQQLKSLDIEGLFPQKTIKDPDMAKACLSGLWLYHNFLDESHTLSQSIPTGTGSYWHGIMHRREPDFSNSKYWFRRVGNHPIFPDLAREAAEIASNYSLSPRANFLTNQTEWDPYAFINLCEDCLKHNETDKELCLKIQLKEWQLLFDYSYRNAI